MERRHILAKVRQEIKDNNLNRVQIFLNICSEFNYDISESMIRSIFDGLATTSIKNLKNDLDLDESYLKLAKDINAKILDKVRIFVNI